MLQRAHDTVHLITVYIQYRWRNFTGMMQPNIGQLLTEL